jgi:trehalose 6-phosphate phosphatase
LSGPGSGPGPGEAASPDLPGPLRPFAAEPATSALFLDFDGTLSAIVADPRDARPLPGVPQLLADLARPFALVAVISGRPTAFLSEVLGAPAGVALAGLYGLERALHGAAHERWAGVVDAVVHEARAGAPPGVYVEPKGLTVTLHWRNAPETGPWAHAFAAREEEERGLRVYPGRMSLELRPPLDVDKGTVVRSLVPGMRAVAVFGDDLGDLPAFDAAAELRARGVAVARVAVVDAESDDRVAAGADLVVEGPSGAVRLLEQLAAAVPVSG